MAEIRLATLADLDRLQAHFEKDDGYPVGWGRRRLEAYVAELGFISLALEPEKATGGQQDLAGHLLFEVWENPVLGVGKFQELHVLEQYRNGGIEAELLKSGIQEAGNYFRGMRAEPDKVMVFMRSNNEEDRRLYQQQGFEVPSWGGKVGNFYSDVGPEELMMVLDLKDVPDEEKLRAFWNSLSAGVIDWSFVYAGKDPKEGVTGRTGNRALEMLVERRFLVRDEGNRAGLTRLEVRDTINEGVVLNPKDRDGTFYFATHLGAGAYVKYLKTFPDYTDKKLKVKSKGAID